MIGSSPRWLKWSAELVLLGVAGSPYALPFPLLNVVLRPDWHDERWYQQRR